MIPYYWTVGFVAVFSFLAELFAQKKKTDKKPGDKLSVGTVVFLFLTAGVLIFIAGSRYYVGTDYGAYYRGLKIYAPRLKEAVMNFDEPGLPLVATIVSWFTKDGAWFIMTCSALTIGLYMIVIYRNEQSYFMASLLFVLTIWDGTFNGVRQYFASAILFCGHRFIYDKKFFKWLLTVFIAACFHISAVVMVTLYFILRNKVSILNIALLSVGTYFVSANYDTLFSFIGMLKDTEMVMNSYATNSVNILRIAVSCAPAVTAIALHFGKEYTKEDTFYTNALVVHGAAMIAASNSTYLARIGIFTSPFVIVGLPKLIRMKNKYVEILVRAGIIVLYGIYWYIEISGSSSLNNYQFVWKLAKAVSKGHF